MSTAFNYNGFLVAPSKPSTGIRTVKKTIYIDSGDRDLVKYPNNGEFVIYLPRVYENVVSVRLKGAEFPIVAETGNARTWSKLSNPPAGTQLTSSTVPLYFFIGIEGLNRGDETMTAADRSTFTDSVFAKIQVPDNSNAIMYSEDSGPTNINVYYPPIGKLDRLAIRVRLHNQNSLNRTSTGDYLYWKTSGGADVEFGLTIELEMQENAFNDASSLETRMINNVGFGQGC